ncbi:MAG TPA: quinolinate synthase NadA [Phycisphaerae bacterium]|nr:quinolinate synthase NadA [Phycisphaerae bacterium]HNU45481.1 quinolinate synthase NadA [Phycisphaerae bacterium]
MPILFQPPLPPAYRDLGAEEIERRIRARKREFGRRVVILGHHYQQDEVIRFADFTGDSLKLSQIGAQQTQAEHIVFCGVHFMAESADMLTGPEVKVILPDLSAGCSMADMADIDDVEDAWDYLAGVGGVQPVPITYVNSSAAVKAFCGRHGGACCTSSNARAIVEWAFTQGDKVLFMPDQHLGRNTAYAMGIPLDRMVVWDPQIVAGGLTAERVRGARVLLWKGHCSVHGLFTTRQCDEIRKLDPAFQIIVHPECPWEVVQKADLAGSTEFIIKTIREADPGSKWAVGTEVHLVNRVAKEHPNKTVRSLAGIQCLCTTMYRIDGKHLLWALDELATGHLVNQVRVDEQTRREAVVALERMLAHVTAQPVAIKRA